MSFDEMGLRVSILGVAEFRRNAGAIRADVAGINQALIQTSGTGASLASKFNSIGSALSRMGRTLTMTATLPILGMGTALLNAGIQFEDAYADVSKTVEGVSDKFGNLTKAGTELRTEIRQMALDIPVSAAELAKLGGQAGELGVSIKAMPEFLKIIAELGVATNMSAETAGDAIARFANIMGVSSKDLGDFASRAGSAIVDLGNKSAATESEIVALTYRLSGAGRAVGLTAQEILGLSTSIAELGIQAEQGGTAASRILLQMQTAAAEGGDDLALFAKAAGVTADEFKNLVKNTPIQAFYKLVAGLSDMQEAGTLTSDTLTGLGMNTIRLRDLVNRLGPNMSNLTKNINTANTAWAENTALTVEAEKKFKTVKNQLILLKNNFSELGIVIFDLYKNQITGLIGVFTKVVKKLGELHDGTIKTIVKIALLAAALGPVLIILGTLFQLIATGIGSLGILSSLFGSLAIPVLAVAAATKIFGINWGEIIGKITDQAPKVIKSVKEIGGWLGKAFTFNKNKKGGDILTGIGGVFKALTYVYKDQKTTFFSKLFESFGMGTEKAQQLGMAVRDFLSPILLKIGQVFDNLSRIVQDFLYWIGQGNWEQAFRGLSYNLLTLIGLSGPAALGLTNILENMFNAVVSVFNYLTNTVFPAFVTIIGQVVNILTGGNILEALSNIWKAIVPVFEPLASLFMDFIGKVWSWIKEQAAQLPDKLSEWGKAFGQWLVDAIPDILAKFLAFMSALRLWIAGEVPKLMGSVAQLATAFISWLDKAVVDMLPKLGYFLGQVIAWILTTLVPEIIVNIPTLVTAILTFIDGLITDFGPKIIPFTMKVIDFIAIELPLALATAVAGFGKGLLQGLIGGIKDNWGSFKSQFIENFSQLKDIFKQIINNMVPTSIDFGPLGKLSIPVPFPEVGALGSATPAGWSSIGGYSPPGLGGLTQPVGATGGMLSGLPLITGEKGPELFAPGQSGMLLSNNITRMLLNRSAPVSNNNSVINNNNFSPNLSGLASMATPEDIGYELMRLYHMSQAMVIA